MLRLTTIRDALLAVVEQMSDESLMGVSFSPDYRGEWDRREKRNVKNV